MPQLNLTTIAYATISGLLPTLFWLWFWLREDKERPKSVGLIAITFILGMIAVILVVPIQKIFQSNLSDQNVLIAVWAGIEEIAKYLVVALVALHSMYVEKPIDYVMYCIIGGLGFAAMENILFLIKPFTANDTTVSLLTGNLRFLGSTLLHALSTGIVGIALGLSITKQTLVRFFYLIIGLFVATTLHTIFNFFIMNTGGGNLLQVFGFLWVVAVFVIIIIEKLRRMSGL
jgi:protease PrsW